MKKRRGAQRASRARSFAKPQVVRFTKSASTFGRSELLIAAALTVAVLAVYGQVISHQFIDFDDDLYIRDNALVLGGLTLKGVAWAFTTFHVGSPGTELEFAL